MAADSAPSSVAADGGATSAREVGKSDYGMKSDPFAGIQEYKKPCWPWSEQGSRNAMNYINSKLPACLPVKVHPADIGLSETCASGYTQHTGTTRPFGRQLVFGYPV